MKATIRLARTQVRNTSRYRHFLFLVVLAALTLARGPATRVQAADSNIDPAFGQGGKVVTDFGDGEDVSNVLVQQDKKIVAVGSTVGTPGFTLARYNPDGSLDPAFGFAGKVVIPSLVAAHGAVLQPDGKIIVGGLARKSNQDTFGLARFNTDGSLDASFGTGGIVDAHLFTDEDLSAIGLHQDGKIVAVGFSHLQDVYRGIAIAQYNPDGSLDSGFGSGGKVLINVPIRPQAKLACAFQPDNKVVVGGHIFPPRVNGMDFALLRLNADGSIDTTFGTQGIVTTDLSNKNDILYALTLQPDGKIIAAGTAQVGDPGAVHSALVRYNSDGSLDSSFGIDGKVVSILHPLKDEFRAVAVQKDGKIVAAGNNSAEFLIARYAPNGLLDHTFGADGVTTTAVANLTGEVRSLAIQSDGKVIAAGFANNYITGPDFALVRIQGITFDLCIQDEGDGNVLQINTMTGDYLFTDCSGFTLSGTGILRKGAGLITLQHTAGVHRILAQVDARAKKATATIKVSSPGREFTIIDRNITNNTCACQ